jgi:hypothetical protein
VTLGTPLVATNPRGDTVVLAPNGNSTTGPFTEAERPEGGNFTQFSQPVWMSSGTDLNATDTSYVTVSVDDSGMIYVFFLSGGNSGTTTQINVATKPIGGSSWTVTVIQPKGKDGLGFIPNPPVWGAVAPNGAGEVLWLHENTNDFLTSHVQYSTLAPGSTTWSAPAETNVTGGISQLRSAVDANGDISALFGVSGSRNLKGATKAAGGSWTPASTISTASSGSSQASAFSLAMDPSGQATAVWLMSDTSNLNPIVQFSTKALSAPSWPTASARGGANDLSLAGADTPSVAVGPDGTTTVAFTQGGNAFAQTRPAAGGAFSGTTLPNSLTSPLGAQAVAGGDNSATVLWYGMSGSAAAVAGAYRAPGGSFIGVPAAPGSNNNNVVASADGAGDISAVWQNQPTLGNYQFQASGLVTAAPVISNVNFPTTATQNTPFSYSATITPGQWTPAIGIWSFGDGTTGPVSGTHAYSSFGTFNAILTASDQFGNMSTAPVSVTVPGPPGSEQPPGGNPTGTPTGTSKPSLSGLPSSVKIDHKTGKGKASVACGAAAGDQCIVSGAINFTGSLTSRVKSHKIGSFAGKIAGGKRGAITFKLTKAGLKLLKRKHSLKVTTNGRSRNSAGQSVAIKKKMRLKLK